MAAPGKTIICLAGDGGIMLNIQELATVMHNKIPLKVFIYNNDGYLTIKQTQQLGFEGRLMGSTPESGLSFPDFAGIAEAHAIKFKRVRTNTELDGMLADFIAEPGPAICELIMDPEQPQIPKTINKRNPDGSIQPTALEDMYPFLDPEEVKSNLMDD
jgi:acetolactate synthase-1/2/3 large subunit